MKAKQHTEKINWADVRRRLARVLAATEGAVRLSPERARAVMDERARTLARAPVSAPDAAEILEVVTFPIANERYALETRHVREVARVTDCTAVPGAPD